MQVGIRIPGAGPKATPESIGKTARWAEELGFHSIWVSDHVALPEPDGITSAFPYGEAGKWPYPADSRWLDPFLVLSLAASAAPSVALGTSVFVAPLRHPVLLAKQVASLDYLSGGRVIFGIGAGWLREEFDVMGVPFQRRGARTAEMVAVMRAFWRGESVEHRGEYYEVDGFTMRPCPAQAQVPIVWGGHSEYALRRVAAHGDGWHPTQLSIAALESGVARLKALCTEHGRDFGSLDIIVRPGSAYRFDAEIYAHHRELGVTHLVIDPPLSSPPPADEDSAVGRGAYSDAGNDGELAPFRAEMERIADVCSLNVRRKMS